MSVIALTELDTVGSTNDHAKDMARAGAPAGSVVLARRQTAGRGRQGRQWESLAGNLYMSVILRPRISVRDLGQLSFAAAVALAETVEPLLPSSNILSLKWPNDLLINDKKVAGILIETEADFAIAGIGLNLAHAPPGALSLQDLGVAPPSPRALAEKVVRLILVQVSALETQGFAGIRAAWMRRAWRLNQTITARMASKTLQGIFLGIDPVGALQLQMGDGVIKSVSSAEIISS